MMTFKSYLMHLIDKHECERFYKEYVDLCERNQELTGKPDSYFMTRSVGGIGYRIGKTAVRTHPELKQEVKQFEQDFEDYMQEKDYLNNFLSILCRTNVPIETKKAILPEKYITDYESQRLRPAFPKSVSVDEDLTEEYFREKYADEIYYLDKYLVLLML